MAQPAPVVVIGAGPAGLATLKALADVGLPAICFDAGDRPGGLWNLGGTHSSAYRTLHLNTSRGRTEFADRPMPADWPDYPGHDRIAAYLRDYTDHFGLSATIRHDHLVGSVTQDADGPGWTVTATGPQGTVTVAARAVVVASGHNSRPRLVNYPGSFAGEQLHSHDYRGPEQLAGRRVLVVGGGNSAMDIAVDASTVARGTLLSLRRGVWIVPKYLLGRPSDTLNGALARRLPWRLRQRISERMLRVSVGPPQRYGLPAPEHGFLQDHPTISDALLSRLTHGDIEVRPAIQRLDGDGVVFRDGRRDEVDLLVWCTGYQVELPFLAPSLMDPTAKAPPSTKDPSMRDPSVRDPSVRDPSTQDTGEASHRDPADAQPHRADRLPLYRRVFHLDAPGLMFVGLMQSTGSALPVVEAQARLVAAHLAGEYALPSTAEQRAACAAELRDAVKRWGDRRPAMRIDFDAYVVLAARELERGRQRLRRGEGVAWTGSRPTP